MLVRRNSPFPFHVLQTQATLAIKLPGRQCQREIQQGIGIMSTENNRSTPESHILVQCTTAESWKLRENEVKLPNATLRFMRIQSLRISIRKLLQHLTN